MKKIFSAIAIAAMVMGAGTVMADSFTAGIAGNYQKQTQDLAGVNLGANGGVSVIEQNQMGVGGSAALPGSYGAEGQIQGENTNVTLSNGYATHNYDSTATTFGGSTAFAGVGAHGEMQYVAGGIMTLGDANGTASVSGSAVSIDQAVAGGGLGFAVGGAGAYVDYHSDYTYTNAGPTSVINQTGSQDAVFLSGAGGGLNGGGYATLKADQVGGTAAMNDGNGTAMVGGGAAAGQVTTENAAVNGTAGTVGAQTQTHSYSQFSSNGAQTQWASGTVSTGNAVADGVVSP